MGASGAGTLRVKGRGRRRKGLRQRPVQGGLDGWVRGLMMGGYGCRCGFLKGWGSAMPLIFMIFFTAMAGFKERGLIESLTIN
jgi:hypothetical protein